MEIDDTTTNFSSISTSRTPLKMGTDFENGDQLFENEDQTFENGD